MSINALRHLGLCLTASLTLRRFADHAIKLSIVINQAASFLRLGRRPTHPENAVLFRD
jgi:hypothetical protein